MSCCKMLSVGWFCLTQDLDTSLVVFLCATCSGLGPPEGGIVYGLFFKEALFMGKASVSRTHSPGLAERLTEHIECLYRPGLEDSNKPQYRLLRCKLWGVRFSPVAIFPTISQTSAAEALAISMEAPMGNERGCCGRATITAQGRERQGPCASVKAVELAAAKEAAMGEHTEGRQNVFELSFRRPE